MFDDRLEKRYNKIAIMKGNMIMTEKGLIELTDALKRQKSITELNNYLKSC